MNHFPELVELYEYKVDDLLAGRNPRGGRHSLNDLRQELLSAELDPILMRRLISSDRQYRNWRRAEHGGDAPVEPAALPDTSFEWVKVTTEPDEASLMSLRLKTLAWHAEITENLGQMTSDLRYEPQRPTLRVLYAVIENAERAQRGVSTRFSVPASDDPLVSLGNKEVVEEITDNLADFLLTPEGRQSVMTNLSDVRENPFPLHPAEEALRAQLAAAEREHMTPQAREELVKALRAQHPKAPDPRERPAIREASVRLQRLLEEQWRMLPNDQSVPKILFAPSAHALTKPDDHSAELLIYLGGQEQETRWRGLNIRWQSAGPNWQLQVGQQLLMLYPSLRPKERRAALTNGQPSVQVFYEENYVLLRVKDDARAVLGALAAQARAVALLLNPSEAYANLRLARAAAQQLRGAALNLAALTPESAEKFSLATPDDLQGFVRQGLDTLVSRIEKLTPEEVHQALRICAEALHMPQSRVDKLHESLHNTLYNPDDISVLALPAVLGGTRILRSGGHFQSFQMASEPMTIGVKDRAVTLRWDYKNDLMALIPGLPSMQIDDLLVVRLSDVDLMFVRQGMQVAMAAVIHQPGLEDVGLE